MRDEELAIFLVILLVVLAIAFTIHVLYLLTLSSCLSRIQPRNRDMEPAMVWLMFIPCFNLVWQFIMINRIGGSLRNEWHSRRWRVEPDENFGTTVGISYCILALLANIPYIGGIFGLAGLICWIIYWGKIAHYSKRLLETGHYGRPRFDDFDDDYDDDLEFRRAPSDDDEKSVTQQGSESLRTALALEDRGRWERAVEAFEQVIRNSESPDDKEVARRHIEYIRLRKSRQEERDNGDDHQEQRGLGPDRGEHGDTRFRDRPPAQRFEDDEDYGDEPGDTRFREGR
jgi:hypothetical protein